MNKILWLERRFLVNVKNKILIGVLVQPKLSQFSVLINRLIYFILN